MSERELGLTEEGQARRRFLKQAGAVAWAAPFIVTMMSRTPAHAQTTCGTVDPNESGICQVTTPCGTGQQCIPNPNPLEAGSCICAGVPG